MRTNLIELIENCPPPFHDYTLTQWDEWKCHLFFKGPGIAEENANLDLNSVIGHSQGYPKMTWGHMIKNLKRIGKRLTELERTPEYYLQGGGFEEWEFIESDGAIFICVGKHRTTIARYLAHYNPDHFENGSIIKGVKIIHKQIDHFMMDNCMAIFQLLKLPSNAHLRFYHANEFSLHRKDNVFLRNENRPDELPLIFHKNQIEEVRRLLEGQTLLNRFLGNKSQKYLRA